MEWYNMLIAMIQSNAAFLNMNRIDTKDLPLGADTSFELAGDGVEVKITTYHANVAGSIPLGNKKNNPYIAANFTDIQFVDRTN